MQAMDMGSTEATMAQIPSIAPPASYYLQLDPSGQVDILESSLVLSKPNMGEETVYEIQLDPFLMDDQRNVEIINLQNLQGSFQFQPEFLDAHALQQPQQPFSSTVTFDPQPQYTTTMTYEPQPQQQQQYTTSVTYEPQQQQYTTVTYEPQQQQQYTSVTYEPQPQQQQQHTTTVTYEPQQLQFQIDDVNFNQILLGNNVVTAVPPVLSAIIKEEVVVGDEDVVPEFAVETEVIAEADKVPETSQIPASSETAEPKGEEDDSEDSQSEEETTDLEPSETLKSLENNAIKAKAKPKFKRRKRVLPDNIMEFTEEAVIPPLVELYPTPPSEDKPPPRSPSPPPVVTVLDEEEEYEIEWGNASSENKPDSEVPQLIPDKMDPDDELYISFHSRPDSSKTTLCVLCYEWFDSQSDLESHLKSTHEDNMKLYGCKRCGKQFWSRFLRQRHEKTHRFDLKGPIQRYFPKNRPYDHYEKKHFLKRLRQAPITPTYLEHMRRLHSEIKSMEFECFECNEDFRTEEEYREHYEEEHAVQTCIHCRKTLDNSKQLRKHEQDVHGKIAVDKNYAGGAWKLWETSWGDCTEMSEKDNQLVNLYLYHNYSKRVKTEARTTSSGCDNYVDTGCAEITVSAHEATKIMEKRRNKSPEKSRRSKGSGKSRSKKGKSTLAKPTNDNIKVEPADPDVYMRTADIDMSLPFKCEQCKTSYDTEADLHRHLKTHTIRSMAYMCQYCGRGFATHSNRKEHERIHTGDKPYVCPICARAFVQISNLKKHIQTHKDKNNLQCSTCQKQFVKESSLILHQRAHSQDRKFRCHVCDRAYNYASLLKRHMRIHTGENPYSCDDCGMQFHELVSLHYHRKKVHTGERPHRCDDCGRAFILSSDLKKHIKIHERDPNLIKSTTTKTYSRKGKSGMSSNNLASITDSYEIPMIPINGDNITGKMECENENEPMHENSFNLENHMDVDHSEPEAPMKPIASDDEDDDEGGLVINESNDMNMLNVSETESGGVTTEERTININHETNENQTVEGNFNNDIVNNVNTVEPVVS